ncbi:MAG: GGDEF domain-containing protein [Gemmatimonadetes bacterium]|nr:GGDEF domain-containing protein [Gemmatimonadota bacterium]
MHPERPRSDFANAEVLLWQTGYRLGLAVAAGLIAVGLRVLGSLELSPVATAVVGARAADWLPGLVTVGYVLLVVGIRQWVARTRRAGHTLATLMVVADLAIVFWLVFLLAPPPNYDIGLFAALISLQLTHVYFGRSPALLMLGAMSATYLLLNDIAAGAGGEVVWGRVWVRLVVFGIGGLLVTRVQSNLHERLGRLVGIFQRAEEGDFSESYDVGADARPDAITSVGRAYNRMRTQLATIVLTDPLSGCFNRRGFEQQYRRELARAARTHTDLALIALDLDHFKRINDSYGHLVGDQVIAEAGELLRANARAEDVVARTGGEEFMVLAPNTNQEGARLLATRIVEAFRRRTFAEPRAKVSVTVSAGIVSDSVPDDGIAEDLRARADEALYAAKRGGRDRVVEWATMLGAGRRVKDAASPRT